MILKHWPMTASKAYVLWLCSYFPFRSFQVPGLSVINYLGDAELESAEFAQIFSLNFTNVMPSWIYRTLDNGWMPRTSFCLPMPHHWSVCILPPAILLGWFSTFSSDNSFLHGVILCFERFSVWLGQDNGGLGVFFEGFKNGKSEHAYLMLKKMIYRTWTSSPITCIA